MLTIVINLTTWQLKKKTLSHSRAVSEFTLLQLLFFVGAMLSW